MRRLSLLFPVLFVVPLFGSDSPKEYDDKTTVDTLEGTWRCVSFEVNGKAYAPVSSGIICRNWEWTYTGQLDSKGYYKVDTNQKPAWLDMTKTNLPKGENETLKCIYRIDGDVLKIAEDTRTFERPQSFDTKANGCLTVVIYKRVK